MNLRNLHSKIGDNYAWELETFYNYRSFADGIDFFIFDWSYDKYICDHNPKFNITLKILNFIIFDFTVYNIWHTDHPNSPYYGMDEDEDEDLTFDGDFDADGPNYERDNHE